MENATDYVLDGSGSICDWDKIAKNLPGRSNKDCRKRWLNVVAGGLRKGAWTSYEDSQLQEGVKEFGSRLDGIALPTIGLLIFECLQLDSYLEISWHSKR